MSSESEVLFLDNLSSRLLNDFRDETFSTEFISNNAHIFLDHKWINIPKLKQYIRRKEQLEPSLVQIKDEVEETLVSERARGTAAKKTTNQQITIKVEPDLDKKNLRNGYKPVYANDSDVIVISSDSESEPENRSSVKKEDVMGNLRVGPMATRTKVKGKARNRAHPVLNANPIAFDRESFVQESGTVWTDSEIKSFVIDGDLQVTTELWVKRVEYLSEIPYIFPIPKVATAFIIDLRDEKFLIPTSESDPTPRRIDALIKSKNQDSWKGGSGKSDSTARVCFQPGNERLVCRRSRLTCQGCYACAEVDPKLLNITRYDLDPEPRSKIFAAQQATRVAERSSVEQRAATFLNVCRAKCSAVDNTGRRCTGQPRMKEKTSREAGRGHKYWISCSGWKKDFKIGHKTHAIPDDVDEDLLAKLMAGTPLDSDETDTNPCSLVVSGHIGLKLKHCPHPHIKDGVSQSPSAIKNYPCPSRLTIFIPTDLTLRFALVVHPDNIPHSHPIPRIAKASFEAKQAYIKCIEAAGSNGTLTVQKVDQAASTKILLSGQRPGQFDPALYDGRLKRNMIQALKEKVFPVGLGHAGVYDLYRKDLTNEPSNRYIHSFIATPDGGTIVFTCIPSLLALIHDVPSFECDVTFKRVQTLNEWEMVIYYPPVQRALTIARVYIDKAHTDHYRRLFDELQSQILALTGKPLRFQRFSQDGNLLCMGADMEAAQVLGAAQSILATNNVEISGINITSPEELLPYFVRVCLTHSKRGVLDFKPLVSGADYQRILNFPYMKDEAELLDFTAFVQSLGVKKISDWWNHKIKSKWIIPCILQSQSKIDLKHWATTPATTNIGEAQHHWTNKLTGIGLSPVDGIVSARLVDEQAAEEVADCLKNGALRNRHTQLFHRQVRGSQRHNVVARKTREIAEIQGSTAALNARIEEEKELRHRSLNQQRDYEETLKQLPGESQTGSHMSIDLYGQRSTLRGKIADEKEKRRKSNAIQKALIHEKREVIASATGKPAPSATRAMTRIPFKSQPMELEASSSGRVSRASSRRSQSESDVDFLTTLANEAHYLYNDDDATGSAPDEWEKLEQFEEDDDPEAGLDESSSSAYVRGEIWFPTVVDPMFQRQGQDSEREVLHMDNTLNTSTATEYWNSEPEDEDRDGAGSHGTGPGVSYLEMLNDALAFPSTTGDGSEFVEGSTSTSNNSTGINLNQAFNTATSIPSALSSNPASENMDIGWASYNSSSTSNGGYGTTTASYDFGLTPATPAQGFPFDNADYLATIVATTHSPQPDFLPLPGFTSVTVSAAPCSPYLVPQESKKVPDNPNKRLRISNITEENILPDNQQRKRSKPDKLSL